MPSGDLCLARGPIPTYELTVTASDGLDADEAPDATTDDAPVLNVSVTDAAYELPAHAPATSNVLFSNINPLHVAWEEPRNENLKRKRTAHSKEV